MWEIKTDEKFDRQLRRLRTNKDVVSGYKKALTDLINSKDPRKLGKYKHGRLRYCLSYEITKSYRLLYLVNFELNQIQLVFIGDHKTVFGKG